MTGFGKASRTVAGKKITVEIKSLNSKQMDMSARVPSVLREKEIDIRSLVANRLLRGKVDVSVSIEDDKRNQRGCHAHVQGANHNGSGNVEHPHASRLVLNITTHA